MNLSTRNRSEVDLRVSQELKNNKDFIYDTNQTLQKLSQRMIDFTANLDKVVAKSGSDHKSILIQFENLKESVSLQCRELQRRVGDMESNVNKVLDRISEFNALLPREYVNRDEHARTFSEQQRRLDSLEKRTNLHHEFVKQSNDLLKAQFDDKMKILAGELTPEIPEIDPVKEKIDESMAIMNDHIKGVYQELHRVKSDIAYGNKKFENIYTLIERLKGER